MKRTAAGGRAAAPATWRSCASRPHSANTNQSVAGVGVVNYGLSIASRTDVFAITGIRVYDGRDFPVLKKGVGGRTSEDGPFTCFNSNIRGPNRELKDFKWPEQPEAVAITARDTARAVLAESLDRALPELLAP